VSILLARFLEEVVEFAYQKIKKLCYYVSFQQRRDDLERRKRWRNQKSEEGGISCVGGYEFSVSNVFSSSRCYEVE
jgi:hypothetical protein